MKKIILIAMLLFLNVSSAMAAWTLTAAHVQSEGKYTYFSVLCTSDGSALTATDLLAVSTLQGFLNDLKGATLLKMYCLPGTGGVIPNGTLDITLTNEFSAELWADTAISKDAATWHTLNADIAISPPVLGELNLAFNDIGDAGDQVTLYFLAYRE